LSDVNMITMSSHKIYGPKGIGLLLIDEEINLEPLIVGGGQEYGLRSGTLPLPLVVGFAKAIEIAVFNQKNNAEKIKKLIDELSDSPYRSARFISCMVLCDPSGNLVKDTTGICWGEILKNPKYPNGEFESIFWVKEANCVYGELSQSQLNKLGSRGKAAKIMSPFLKKEIGLS